jgi:hypothetical protein
MQARQGRDRLVRNIFFWVVYHLSHIFISLYQYYGFLEQRRARV